MKKKKSNNILSTRCIKPNMSIKKHFHVEKMNIRIDFILIIQTINHSKVIVNKIEGT